MIDFYVNDNNEVEAKITSDISGKPIELLCDAILVDGKIYNQHANEEEYFKPISNEKVYMESFFGLVVVDGEKYVIRETDNGYKYYDKDDKECDLALFQNNETKEFIDIKNIVQVIEPYNEKFMLLYEKEKANFERDFEKYEKLDERDENSEFYDDYINNKDDYYDNLYDDIE